MPGLEQLRLHLLLPVGCYQRSLCWDVQSMLSQQQSVPSPPEQPLVLFDMRWNDMRWSDMQTHVLIGLMHGKCCMAGLVWQLLQSLTQDYCM